MSVVTHRERCGYAKSLRSCCASRSSALTAQAGLRHHPARRLQPPTRRNGGELRRLESGCDVIVAELADEGKHAQRMMRWQWRWAPWLLRLPGVRDTCRLYRPAAHRVAPRAAAGWGAALTTDGWSANAELLARLRRMPAAPRRCRRRRATTSPSAARTTAWQSWWAPGGPGGDLRGAADAALLPLCALPRFGGAQEATTLAPSALRPRVRGCCFPWGAPGVRRPPGGVQRRRGGHGGGGARYRARYRERAPRFHIEGGALWYHLDQTLESGGKVRFPVAPFVNHTEEKEKRWDRVFDIFPDSDSTVRRDATRRTPPCPSPSTMRRSSTGFAPRRSRSASATSTGATSAWSATR